MTAGDRMTWSQIRQTWLNAGGDPTAADMAASVAMAESGGDPTRRWSDANGTTVAVGLWRIPVTAGHLASPDPVTNALGASVLSNHGRDWRSWPSAWVGRAIAQNPADLKGYLGPGSQAVIDLTTARGDYNVVGAVITPAMVQTGGGAIRGTAGTGDVVTGSASSRNSVWDNFMQLLKRVWNGLHV